MGTQIGVQFSGSSTFVMGNLWNEWLDVHPHPNPLPRGEGTAVVRSLAVGSASGQSSRRFALETADVTPSPGGSSGSGYGKVRAGVD